MIAKIRSIFLYALFLINFLAFGGFPAGTLISSGDTYIPIEKLSVGDLVTCYDFKSGYTEKPIVATQTHTADETVFLMINGIGIFTAKDQKFYVPDQKKWKNAVDLEMGDCLFSTRLDKKPCIVQKIEQFKHDDILYDISVQDCHNFLILKDGILVHNIIPAIPFFIGAGIKLAFESLFTLASYELTSAFLVGAVGAASCTFNYLRNKNKNNWQHRINNYTVIAENCGAGGPSGNNNNDDDDEQKKKAFNKASEIAHQVKEAAKDALVTEAINGALEQTQKIHHNWRNKKTKTTPAPNHQPNKTYHDAGYHSQNGYTQGYNGGIKSPAPIDGQAALNNSFQVKDSSPRRIGISNNQFVILDQTLPGEYHGHVRTWKELTKRQDMNEVRDLLIKKRFVSKKGKILVK